MASDLDDGRRLDLVETVLNWSVEDIFNQDLVKDKEQEACMICASEQCGDSFKESLVSSLSQYNLNDSQVSAISSVISMIKCTHSHAVKLIQGPPGTGKTNTVSKLLWTLLQQNFTILTCASTNVAIKEVASRVLKLVRDSNWGSRDCIHGCFLGDMLLVGNKERLSLDVDDDLNEIFLDYRVTRLSECLDLRTGWEHKLTSMINFLDTCGFEYNRCTADMDCQAAVCFVDFLRPRFDSIAVTLEDYAVIILTHLPREFISDLELEYIDLLLKLLSHLRKLMSIMDSSSKELERIFSSPMNTEIPDISSTKNSLNDVLSEGATCTSLQVVRIACHDTLQYLKRSFKRPSIGRKDLLRSASLVLCTTSSAAFLHSFEINHLEVLIIDEAAQIKECESAIPLQLDGLRHAVLIGDERQLCATVKSKISEECGFGRSLFERLVLLGHSKDLLNVQYRMHPSITWVGKKDRLSIGIVSPYTAQVLAIQEKLIGLYDLYADFVLSVKSIDGFQGGETDVIILSTVRCNAGGSIDFLSNLNRANVALTRARHCLWVIGNGSTLISSGSVWKHLVLDAEQRGFFFNAGESKYLGQVIMETKQELDQLDNLLSEDSVLFMNSRWKVVFSNEFKKSFVKLASLHTKKFIISFLLKLAGGWRPKMWMRTEESASQLVNQHKIEGLHLVWTVDVIKDSVLVQILKVWDILPLAGVPKLVKRLENIFLMYTDIYTNYCKTRHIQGKLVVPMTWENSEGFVRYKSIGAVENYASEGPEASDLPVSMEKSNVHESLLLMKFYSLSSGIVKHLLTSEDGNEIELPLEVTDKEREIILFPKSTFILGRSGTGKTTALTMKLIQNEQNYCLASKGLSTNTPSLKEPVTIENPLRQMFVTVSQRLCSAVKNHVVKLQRVVLEGKCSHVADSAHLYDINDNLSELMNIPDSFTDVHDEQFPLVITFQKFLLMLDGTIPQSYFARFRDVTDIWLREGGQSKSLAFLAFIKRKEVAFDRFHSFYWPHFDAQKTKKLDALTVFSQIISHIKGGYDSGVELDCTLSRSQYLMLSGKRVSTLNLEEREVIYDIFLDYEKRKLETGDFDLSDLIINLHSRLKNQPYRGKKLDFVFVDEVQDLTMRQIALFKYVCSNVCHGFIFAGDTAQTIAKGVDFRFQEIRSLFYREFLSEFSTFSTEKVKDRDLKMSDLFFLDQNFRTHDGVLKLARTVVELLYNFFPMSVDILSPEVSLICGEVPIVLESGSNENVIIKIFGGNGNFTAKFEGFGAEQVILVRDDCMKRLVVDHIGNQALVLTIVECKGLEFQLFNEGNFVMATMCFERAGDVYGAKMAKAASLEATGDHLLCTNIRTARDMLRQAAEIYQTIGKTEAAANCYMKLQEYRIAGQIYMEKCGNERLEDAGDCFAFATCWSEAADVYAKGKFFAKCLDSCMKGKLFNKGLDFIKLWKEVSAFEHDARNSGELDKVICEYLESCAFHYHELNDHKSMMKFVRALPFIDLKLLAKSLASCEKRELLDEGLNFIELWKEVSTPEREISEEFNRIIHDYLERCALHYHKHNDYESMMKFVCAFPSMDLARSFLRDRHCFGELLAIEKQCGNFLEAAKTAKMMGNLLSEAEMLEKAGRFGESSRLIIFHVVISSLWTSGSKGWPLKQFEQKDELIMKAKLLATMQPLASNESIFVEADFLSRRETSFSELLQDLNNARRLGNIKLEALISRAVLDLCFKVNPSKYSFESELVLNPLERVTEMMVHNRTSPEILVYFWNLFKNMILSLLQCIQSLEQNAGSELENYERFCLEYMGIQKLDDPKIYVAVKPEASWVQGNGKSTLCKKGNSYHLSSQHVQLCARKYWSSELFSVGFQVLEKLEALWSYSSQKSDRFSQGLVVLQVFDISSFLLRETPVEGKCRASKLHNLLGDSKFFFFNIIFPLDGQEGMTEKLLQLRQNDKALRLLDELIHEKVTHEKQNRMTHGWIGKLVVLLFLRGKFGDEHFELVKDRLNGMPLWKPFIVELKEYLGTRCVSPSFICAFAAALQCSYDANWTMEVDYISPQCFMFLIEQLVLLTSASQVSNDCWYCTKSIFCGLLVPSDFEPFVGLCSVGENVCRDTFLHIFNLVLKFLEELLFQGAMTKEWIKISGMNVSKYYPLLILQLVVCIVIIHVNSRSHFGVLWKLLKSPNILFILPSIFREQFCKAGSHLRDSNTHFLVGFAKALKAIDNPMVVMNLKNVNLQLLQQEALILTPELVQCRNNVLDVFFPKSTKRDSQTKKSSEDVVRNSACVDELASDSPNKAEDNQKSNMEKICDDLQGSFIQLWNMFIAFSSFVDDGNTSAEGFASAIESVKKHQPRLQQVVGSMIPSEKGTDSTPSDVITAPSQDKAASKKPNAKSKKSRKKCRQAAEPSVAPQSESRNEQRPKNKSRNRRKK
ncbi:TPR and ankyrin repeat-containing protein 1 [Nymphaea thermarum]|nr:TPR and ankyrin repeat-containing protein 1 [Nymphaea thermarum]